MKRFFPLLLALALLLCGCDGAGTEQQQYTATFLTVFDTVTTVVGRDGSEKAFTERPRQSTTGSSSIISSSISTMNTRG